MKRYELLILICALIGLGVAVVMVQRTKNHSRTEEITAAERSEPEKKTASEDMAITITANNVTYAGRPNAVVEVNVEEKMQFVAQVTSGGDKKLYYQWWKDKKPITKATNSTYTIVATAHGDEGEYNCTATDDEKVASDWMKLWRNDE